MLVEDFVEEDDLAGDFVAAEGLEFVEGVDGDDVGGEAVGRSGGASAERGENDFLCGVGNHSGILDEGGGFGAADPVRHDDRLEADLEAKLAKFGGDIFGGGAGLGRAAGARSDIFGEVSELAVGVVVVERGSFDGGKLLQEKRREIRSGSLGCGHPRGQGRLGLWRVLRAREDGREEQKCDQSYDAVAATEKRKALVIDVGSVSE